jgi:hypothetical protein
MKFEKEKMLMVSPIHESAMATFSNDIVNAIKVVFGDTLPIEVCALENNKNSTITTRKSATLNSSKKNTKLLQKK